MRIKKLQSFRLSVSTDRISAELLKENGHMYTFKVSSKFSTANTCNTCSLWSNLSIYVKLCVEHTPKLVSNLMRPTKCRGDVRDFQMRYRLDDWIYWHLIQSTLNCKWYSAIAYLYTLQFTVTHALGFSVFVSRILAMDFLTVSLPLQITHEVLFA
jgi:hypothetical protein